MKHNKWNKYNLQGNTNLFETTDIKDSQVIEPLIITYTLFIDRKRRRQASNPFTSDSVFEKLFFPQLHSPKFELSFKESLKSDTSELFQFSSMIRTPVF